MSDKVKTTEIKYAMPSGFECPICVRASMDIYGSNVGLGEVYYRCISCDYMITIKKMLP